MFITIGCLYLSLIQQYSKKRRLSMYSRIIPQVLKNGSFMVQRCSGIIPSGRSTSLLDSSYTISNNQDELFRDKDCVYYEFFPKIKVNLESWTAYYAVTAALEEKNTDRSMDSTTILLESHRPTDIGQFMQETFSVPLCKQIHILNKGTPLAWKSGPPFGIVLKCTVENLLQLCMAFADGVLTMDEDLIVHRISSIETEGTAASLTSQVQDPCLADEKQDVQTEHTSEWSNESLADSASILNVDVQGLPDPDVESVDLDHEQEDTFSLVDTGSGEALYEVQSSQRTTGDMEEISKSEMKPPNVLIYCGVKDAKRKFENLKVLLEECLNCDRYVIYHLPHEQIHSTPWAENSELLLVSTENLYDKSDEVFCQYFENRGKIISFGSNLDSMFVPRREIRRKKGVASVNYDSLINARLLCGRYVYESSKTSKETTSMTNLAVDDKEQVVMLKLMKLGKTVTENGDTVATPRGMAILSQVLLDQDPTDTATSTEVFNELKASNSQRIDILLHILEHLQMDCTRVSVPAFTPCHLLTREEELKRVFINTFSSRLKENVLKAVSVSLHFVHGLAKDVPQPTASILPLLLVCDSAPRQYFDIEKYWQNLNSKTLGNVVMYTDVLPTTMTLFDSLQFSVPKSVGLIAIAGRQTQGKGRGGNVWLSPPGCAMFSLHVRFDVDSNLGRAASFLQHITSLAVVEGVRSMPGYEDIDLRLKWPNDIYYSDKMKFGGVIVKSTIMDGQCHAIIGCGFNVSNSNPTICINDLIRRHNNERGDTLPEVSKEQLIARTVTVIEEIIEEFQREGQDKFCHAYYKRWLHSGCKVRLESEGNAEVTIEGLDTYGYLEVSKADGSRVSVQPDGNSFDMMRNLITLKANQ